LTFPLFLCKIDERLSIFMNTERVKLIVKNMELLLHSLKQELNSAPEEVISDENSVIIPYGDDYDEVFSE
jgi:hypothetical protein